jgi:hypothetical protein
MKLTRKFWGWIGQVGAAIVLIWRMDLLGELFELIPNVNLSQVYLEIGVVKFAAIVWGAWLVWRGIKGLTGEMEFLIDPNDHRW